MTVSRETVLSTLDSLPDGKRWKHRREWDYVTELLADQEKIIAVSKGIVETNSYLIVVTTQRLILLERRFLLGVREREIFRDAIQSVSHQVGVLFGSVTIKINDNKTDPSSLILRRIEKRDVPRVVRALTVGADEAIRIGKVDDAARSNGIYKKADAITQLERLASLRDRGVLTEEEFTDEKRVLLEKVQLKHAARIRELETVSETLKGPAPKQKKAWLSILLFQPALTLNYMLLALLLCAAAFLYLRDNNTSSILLAFAAGLFGLSLLRYLREKLHPLISVSTRVLALAMACAVFVVVFSEEKALDNLPSFGGIDALRLESRARLKGSDSGEPSIEPQIILPKIDSDEIRTEKRETSYPAGSELVLRAWRWREGYELVTVEGQVTNISKKMIEQISAVATFYDTYEATLFSAAAPIDRDPFPAGETSMFRIVARFNPSINSVGVRFVGRDGREVNVVSEEKDAKKRK